MNSDTIKMVVMGALVLAVFGVLWYQGQIARFGAYVAATREELKKCTWPTLEELQGQTLLIFVAIGLLGGFTILVDLVSSRALQYLVHQVS
jgi:preprotein translocase SecE subunit